jgi:hypothetical protein
LIVVSVPTLQLGCDVKVPLSGTEGKARRCSLGISTTPPSFDYIRYKAGEGKRMTSDKGNRLAKVIPEEALSDQSTGDPKLDRGIQTRIGDQLRAMYDELMEQPVPDRFKDLLAKLDQSNEEKA